MISLIVTLAIIGLIAWAIVTYVPMPQPIKTLIIIVVVVCCIIIVINAFGITNYDLPVPRLRGR
jgi:hypothetical protein